MSDIERLRGLLRDRLHKEGALGTADAEVCLDTSLIEDLLQLEEQREAILADAPKDTGGRLASAPEPDTSEIEAKIDAKNEEIAAATVKLTFKSLSSVAYQEVLNRHPDIDKPQPEDRVIAAFYDDLADCCIVRIEIGGVDVTADGSPTETLAELRKGFTFGEWEPIRRAVFTLNRRKVPVPFSSKRSGKTR